MSHLRFLSTTSIVLVAGVATVTGCSDNSCGPGGAPDSGIIASSDMVTLTYGLFAGSLNNDCPAAGAPSGVVSMTIIGHQADSVLSNSTGLLTLCVARPDLLAKQAQMLGVDAGAQVRVVDLGGDANSCSFAIDKNQPATGNATSSGLCGNGSDAAGFAIELNGSLTLTRTCGTAVDSVQITLHGKVAVSPGVLLMPG
jgi:hypothetical protein